MKMRPSQMGISVSQMKKLAEKVETAKQKYGATGNKVQKRPAAERFRLEYNKVREGSSADQISQTARKVFNVKTEAQVAHNKRYRDIRTAFGMSAG